MIKKHRNIVTAWFYEAYQECERLMKINKCYFIVKATQAPVKETRTVGSQLSLPKPSRISHYTQTKWKGHDKGKLFSVSNIVFLFLFITCLLLYPVDITHSVNSNYYTMF